MENYYTLNLMRITAAIKIHSMLQHPVAAFELLQYRGIAMTVLNEIEAFLSRQNGMLQREQDLWSARKKVISALIDELDLILD